MSYAGSKLDRLVREEKLHCSTTFRGHGWDCELTDPDTGVLLGWCENTHSTSANAEAAAMATYEKEGIMARGELAA